jgi:hypothetical protein
VFQHDIIYVSIPYMDPHLYDIDTSIDFLDAFQATSSFQGKQGYQPGQPQRVRMSLDE